MMRNLKIKYMVAPISAAILFYSAATEQVEPLYEIKECPALKEIYPQGASAFLKMATLGIENIYKIKTLHKFASKIYENTIDLEPAIIEMVDRKFWELI